MNPFTSLSSPHYARAAVLVAGAAAAALIAACVDTFHGTDFQTLCERELSAPGCLGDNPDSGRDADADATPDANPADPLCVDEPALAIAIAEKTCARLGAIGGPLDSSAFGACMALALPAYDCKLDPARKPLGAKRVFYICMREAKDAESVRKCITSGAPQRACPIDSTIDTTQCGADSLEPPAAQVGQIYNRYACSTSGFVAAEPCVARGQRCGYVEVSAASRCLGIGGNTCAANGCRGSNLQQCEGTQDRGRDCALEGAGRCEVGGGVPVCVPLPTAGTCSATPTKCDGNVAEACIAGNKVRVDCTRMGLSCKAPATPSNEAAPETLCEGAGACTESCDGAKLKYCLRGKSVAVDCVAQGLLACESVNIGGTQVPRCKAP